jgi:hypothetical protein
MRFASTSLNVSSLAASAASRTLSEPVRVEPGMINIFGDAIFPPDAIYPPLIAGTKRKWPE